jgi:hypothetical protein
MRRSPAIFPALTFGAMMLAPVAGAQARDVQEGPVEIEQCQTIDKPGSYRLVNNLVAGTHDCLVITADFVTIDLAGFSISGTAVRGQNSGIWAPLPPQGSRKGLAVRNGSISGFGFGVNLPGAVGSIVEGLRVFGDGSSSNFGIGAEGIVRNNTVIGINGTGIGTNGTVTGNYASSTRDAFVIGPGSTVIGNTAGPGGNVGFAVDCPANLIDNTSTGNQSNLDLNGNDCHIEDNLTP